MRVFVWHQRETSQGEDGGEEALKVVWVFLWIDSLFRRTFHVAGKFCKKKRERKR